MNQFLKYLRSLIFSQQKDLKLNVLLEALKKNASEDLFIQIELYEKCQLEDEQEAFSKNGLNFNSPQEIFNAICLKTQNFQNVSKKFLELLQFIHQMSEFHGEQHNSSLQMENLFSKILLGFSASPINRGFWGISSTTLKLAEIPTIGYEKNTLTILANLRNSFYVNGINRNHSLSVEIGGTRFEFCKGKPVTCASWKHIVVVLLGNISTLESILLSKIVSNHKSEISDIFSSSGS